LQNDAQSNSILKADTTNVVWCQLKCSVCFVACEITDKSDYGEYVCVASNARGSDVGSVHLNGQ